MNPWWPMLQPPVPERTSPSVPGGLPSLPDSGGLAWQRALEQASALDYGEWFKPTLPAAPCAHVEAMPRAAAAPLCTTGPAAFEGPASAAPAVTVAPLAPDAPAGQDVAPAEPPVQRRLALVADVAAAWVQAAPEGEASVPVEVAGMSRPVAARPTAIAWMPEPPDVEPTEALAETRTSPVVSATEDAPEPLRVHAQWSAQGVSVWLGCDAAAVPALDEIIVQLQRTLAARGERLLGIVCNGREVWRGAPPSGLSPFLLPASRRPSPSSNRPYEAP